MKKYVYLPALILGLVVFHVEIEAQRKKSVNKRVTRVKRTPTKSPSSSSSIQTSNIKIYLKTDALFKNFAAQESDLNNEALGNFGQSVEKDLSTEARPETRAASLLILLQNNPESVIAEYSDANADYQQKSLRADNLITEIVRMLIRASDSGAEDPLNEYIDKLQSAEGQELLNEDLRERLGMGVIREIKAVTLIISIRGNFNREALQQIREALRTSKEAAKLPYPLCLIKKPCP